MKIFLLISFSLIIFSLNMASTQKTTTKGSTTRQTTTRVTQKTTTTKVKLIQINRPKVTLKDSNSLTSKKIHKKIVSNKRLSKEMYDIIKDCVTKNAPGATLSYLNVEFNALKPKTCTSSTNLRVDLQSSKAGKFDTWAVKINDESQILKPEKGRETVCVLSIEKPSSFRYLYAFKSIKVQRAFNKACNRKKIALMSRN